MLTDRVNNNLCGFVFCYSRIITTIIFFANFFNKKEFENSLLNNKLSHSLHVSKFKCYFKSFSTSKWNPQASHFLDLFAFSRPISSLEMSLLQKWIVILINYHDKVLYITEIFIKENCDCWVW